MKRPAHRPITGETAKNIKISIRIEQKDYDLIIKKYGKISAGINDLLKRLRQEGEK